MFKSEPMFKLLTTFTGLKLSNVNITEQGEESDNDSKSKEETAVEEKVILRDSHDLVSDITILTLLTFSHCQRKRKYKVGKTNIFLISNHR